MIFYMGTPETYQAGTVNFDSIDSDFPTFVFFNTFDAQCKTVENQRCINVIFQRIFKVGTLKKFKRLSNFKILMNLNAFITL